MLMCHANFHTTGEIPAARGPYYTIKKLEIAEERTRPAAPTHILSAIGQSISRIRTARLRSFIPRRAKSSIVVILRANHFGALRAISPWIRVNNGAAASVSTAAIHFVSVQGEPEHDEPAA
jgi:hypothetical protein